MPKAEQSTAETLFHHWRRGDARAGQAMAQRFTDWYFSIIVGRVGEPMGSSAFRAAVKRFGEGVPTVTDARRLLRWSHGILSVSLQTLPTSRLREGDHPSRFTRNQHPKMLLVDARSALTPELELLEACYQLRCDRSAAHDILEARFAVKRWLQLNASIPFRVLPTRIDPDLTPLPFYEAGALDRSPREVQAFEVWAVNQRQLCQDLAEFAHFAIALRSGLPTAQPRSPRQPLQTQPAPLPRPGPSASAAPQDDPLDTVNAPTPSPTGRSPVDARVLYVIIAVLILVVLFLAARVVIYG